MAIQKLGLTRDQLASFLGDFEQIKQFEKLFATVNDVVDVDVQGTSIAAGNAQASANEALALIEAIKNSIAFVETAQAIQNNNSTATDYVDFSTTAPTPAVKVGRAHWDGGTTLGVQMTNNVIGRVNEDLFYYIKASSAITKGQVIMFTGAVGSSGVPTGAPATGVTDGTYIMGVAAESISNNGFGLVQYNGTLKGINTSAFVDGDILWYDPAVTGGFTKVKPLAPNIKVQMAAVINAGSGGSGSILIRVNSGSELGGTDSNVQFSTLADKDLIQYYGAGPYWRNVAYSNITVGYADNLTGGAANKIAYQTALNTTGFIDAPTVASTVLTWNGSAFTWTTPTTGTVTSIDVSGGTTGLTFSGGPITTSGTITMAGTLGVVSGGTGTSTAFTAGSVVFAGTSGVYGQDNANFFWDDSNNRLGVGTNVPQTRFHVREDSTGNTGVLIQNRNATGFPAAAAVYFISGAFDLSDDRYAMIKSDGASNPNIQFWTGEGVAPLERMRVAANGFIGFGITVPRSILSAAAPTGSVLTLESTDTTLTTNDVVGKIDFYANDASTNGTGVKASIRAFSGASAGNAISLAFATSSGTGLASDKMLIDFSGNVVINYTTTFPTALAIAPQFSLGNIANGSGGGITLGKYRNSPAVGADFEFTKSRTTTVGVSGIGVNNDLIGTMTWSHADGTGFVQAASISANIDGTPGTNDMPGRLVFNTTADGASTPTERMRINSSGNVGINESAPDYRLDVNGAIGFTPGASVTPVDNGDVVFELTNNTTLTVKAKGSDGVVRSGTITLS